MLELSRIRKEYPVGGSVVHALRGVDLRFRKNEFVSILGPSGCGKTTLLNIIGGLDQYTEGDLKINGVSTRHFKDRDWDTYRNHSIGFVFQSYHLIPHQNVLQNVELALTLSGVSKKERRERAKKALASVGLSSQFKKRPSEMSGGQMQRVAIARALVNDPDILLADEPTGALDTETSVQVMEILKEISKERLVIMVTHNPDLAQQYSTRIIRMLDGEITGDTAPLTEEEIRAIEAERQEKEQEVAGKKRAKRRKEKKPSMSFFTAFSLSLKNLFTKKGRTVLTSFAGSIGIIGIALITALSQGFSTYITEVQESTLASYPLVIESQVADLSSLMKVFMSMNRTDVNHDKDAVYVKPAIYDMMEAMSEMEESKNDLKSFKAYLEKVYADAEEEKKLNEAINGIQYEYDLDLQIYTTNVDGKIHEADTLELFQKLLLENIGLDMSSFINFGENMGMSDSPMMSMMSPSGGTSVQMWQELLPGEDGKIINPLLEKQYELAYGNWPNQYNEIVLVLDENNELDDLTLYALGLQTEEYVAEVMKAAMNGAEIERNERSWTYKEICQREFKTILNAACYRYDENTGLFLDLRETEAGLKYLYDNGLSLRVSGVIRPREDADATMLSGSIGYTSLLTEYVIEQANQSEAVKAQIDNPHRDIFTGLPFSENTGKLTAQEKKAVMIAHIEELNEKEKAALFKKIVSLPSKEYLETTVQQAIGAATRADMEATMLQVLTMQMNMDSAEVTKYLSSMSDGDLISTYSQMVTEQIKRQYAAQVQATLVGKTDAELAMGLTMASVQYTDEQWEQYYDETMTFSESSYEKNLKLLGKADLTDPTAICLFASSFENKEIIEDAIAAYNETVDEVSKITYTDYVGLIMSSVTGILDAITYVLIAFVSISLIVSSIMIGVITLISVQERTKEIGILRALGASRRNVSSMFNAETVIIGLSSGLVGVGVTYLLCIPINAVIHLLTGIENLDAYLPITAALLLVAISVLLTLFSGLIPSRSAAKKDPVVALRTE